MYDKCKVISELGCNHQGSIDTAKEMILQSKLAGANFIKLQKRDLTNYPKKWDDIYNSENSFGSTYYEHRKFLEFSIKQHIELKEYAESINIDYSTSVWDLKSAELIRELKPKYIKIPSALNSNYELIEYCLKHYSQVHVSLGMATKKERKLLLNYLNNYKNKVVIYWTTSTYPSKFEELFLLEIKKIKEQGFITGYSGHHLGIAADLISIAFKINYIERHFTLDRTMKGSDQVASLEKQGLNKLIRDIRAVEKALQYKGDDITDGEKINRKKLRND